jgi:hypothetical protein
MLTNPFGVVSIGSTFVENGKFGSTILDGKAAITNLRLTTHISKTMRGQSAVVYDKQMNQISVGFSGSYGFSGLAQCKAAVAAYGGLSTANASKTDNIEYHVLMTAGVETVMLDSLSSDMFVEALALGPKRRAKAALDAYCAMNVALAGDDLALVLADAKNAKYGAVKTKFDAWTSEVEVFRKNYGDGIVIGLVWGGIGASTLTITDASNSRTWKYGGTADFSYVSASGGVSIGATYDASGSKDTSKISVSCASETIGDCVRVYTDAWDQALNGKAFDALANMKPLETIPLTATAVPPSVPQFVAPTPDSKTTADAETVTKDDLNSAAKVAAYDAVKAKYDKLKGPHDPDFSVTLADFIKSSSNPPDPNPTLALKGAVGRNALSTRSLIKAGKKTQLTPHHLRGAGAPSVAVPGAGGAAATASYEPIGVWITEWASLLPWLATGRDNRIDDTSAAEPVLKYRMMLQDFLALSRLYRYAETLDLKVDDRVGNSPFPPPPDSLTAADCQQIADEFASQCSALADFDPFEDNYADKARAAYENLGDAARAIYDRWDEVGFLRSCELGMGVLVDANASLGPASVVSTGLAAPFDSGSNMAVTKCLFNRSSGNFASFARFEKLLPLIVPQSGRIIAIHSTGALAGYGTFTKQNLSQDFADPQACWDPGGNIWAAKSEVQYKKSDIDANGDQIETCLQWQFMSFNVDSSGFLEFAPSSSSYDTYTAKKVQLFPIPFSAAKNVTWHGESFSTNLAADQDLDAKLNSMAAQLKTAQAWDFTGDDFSNKWSGDQPYDRKSIRKQYFGLIEEPAGSF